MSIFNTAQSIGDIVSIMPKASEVFRKYSIDFCCGGNRPLSEAIKNQQLSAAEVLGELEKTYEETEKYASRDLRKMPSSELIDYIVNTHHAFLNRALPELSGLATKILRVHGSHHEELFRVHKLFHTLRTELEQHLVKEEEILFPLIKGYEKKPSRENFERLSRVMKETEDEHEAAGDVLKELRQVTGEYKIPVDVCGTFCLTYEKLQELEADLFQHIHLENNILFKRLGLEADSVKM